MQQSILSFNMSVYAAKKVKEFKGGGLKAFLKAEVIYKFNYE